MRRTRPRFPRRSAPDSVTSHARISPINAFWRSFLLPGWGQARLEPQADGRYIRGVGGRDARHESQDPSRARPTSGARVPRARTTSAGSTRTGSSCSRSTTCSPASRPTSAAHLTDFPGDLKIQALPGGVGRRRSPSRSASDERRRPSASSTPASAGSRSPARSSSGSPRESTVYFGDTARVPYGPKSPETVRRYSLEILRWLLEQGVKAVVIACNTSTAHALETLQAESPVPVIGVIEPGARGRRGGGRRAADRRHRHRRHHREQRLRQGDPAGRGPTRESSSGPARSSCRWSRRAGSSTRRPS